MSATAADTPSPLRRQGPHAAGPNTEAVEDHTATDWSAPQRLHPLYLLTGLGAYVKGLPGMIAGGAYFAASGRWTWLVIGLAGYLVASMIGLWLTWLRLSWRVADEQIEISSGLIARKHRSIPFDRIQDVSIEQGPIARLAGIARVKLETGASGDAGGEDGRLDAVALPVAAALRDAIRAHRAIPPRNGEGDHSAQLNGGGVLAPAPGHTGEALTAPVFAMDSRRVLTAGFYNFSLALLAVLAGASQTFGELLGVDPFEREFWDRLLDAGSPIAGFVRAHRWLSVVGGLATLVGVGIATGVIRTVLREWGFRVDATETGLRRRRGLLTRTDVVVPVRRVQAATIATGPIREGRGWAALKLQSLARDDAKSADHVVAPLADEHEIAALLRLAALPAPADDLAWQPAGAGWVMRLVIILAPLALLGAAALAVAPFAAAPLLGLAALGLGLRLLDRRRRAHALDRAHLFVRSGFWQRRTVILPLTSIQSADVARDPLDRLLGLASVRLGVAGGSIARPHRVVGLGADAARALRRDLLAWL